MQPSYEPIPAVAAATGIPARTLRTWAADGDVASQPPGLGERGRRVNREEVLQVARARGRIVAVAAAIPSPSVAAEFIPEQPLSGKPATAIATTPQSPPRPFSGDSVALAQALDRLHLDALNLTTAAGELRAVRVAVERQAQVLLALVVVLTFGFGAVVVTLLTR